MLYPLVDTVLEVREPIEKVEHALTDCQPLVRGSFQLEEGRVGSLLRLQLGEGKPRNRQA